MKTKNDTSCLHNFARMCSITILNSDQYIRYCTTHSCIVDGMVLSAIPYGLKDLTSEILCRNSNSFAFLLDYNECVHLYALCGFFASTGYDSRYEQAWGYEVPTISVLSEIDTICCRLVALNSPRMKYTPFLELLSVRRCIGNLLIKNVFVFIINFVIKGLWLTTLPLLITTSYKSLYRLCEIVCSAIVLVHP